MIYDRTNIIFSQYTTSDAIMEDMKKLKVISRAIVIHDDKILLVKNIDRDFWSLPGGHWEFDRESLVDCAIRETEEETGYRIVVKDMIFCQELRKPGSVIIEAYWSADLANDNTQSPDNPTVHIDSDKDSEIESVAWFSREEVGQISILPAPVKECFLYGKRDSAFIGTFNLSI